MVARACLLVFATFLVTGPTLRADEPDAPNPKGKPTAYKAGSGMYAIWYDDAGWHIRMSAGKEMTTFHTKVDPVDGKITSLKFVDTTSAKTPPPPKGKKEPAGIPGLDNIAGKGLDLNTKLGKGLESGYDFKVDDAATALKVTLTINDKEAPELILIGTKGVHPKEASFELPAKPAKK